MNKSLSNISSDDLSTSTDISAMIEALCSRGMITLLHMFLKV